VNAVRLPDNPTKQMNKIISALLFVLCGSAHAVSFDELLKPENLRYSWQKAVVYEPDSIFPKSIEFLNSPSKYPVMIYMHGCAGLNDDSREWARIIKNLGFIVIQPDSFAIPGRRSNCDSQNQRAQIIQGFDSFRLRNQELFQARNELLKLSWVNQDRVFLMGHSEGGMTVSRTSATGFKAVIASGYWCHEALQIKHGAAPFLLLNWQEDPWYRNRSKERNTDICQWHVDNRPSTAQVIIEGQGHATSGSRKAKLAVEEFLKPFRD
jgi:dienelactone hydrolase